MCRSLQWERGLKFVDVSISPITPPSFPAMGTWIEIPCILRILLWIQSFPAMGTWIEIAFSCIKSDALLASFPAMGTWIEMNKVWRLTRTHRVVPCNGNVD